ncbi:hypothetical protein, partial [Streptomyces sp. NPDC056045]|uniref:hypothetical protein n=1 Tax=Streptomyces sp. NPDC056045 TaxID=3345691 RepID=UPI0035DC9318
GRAFRRPRRRVLCAVRRVAPEVPRTGAGAFRFHREIKFFSKWIQDYRPVRFFGFVTQSFRWSPGKRKPGFKHRALSKIQTFGE